MMELSYYLSRCGLLVREIQLLHVGQATPSLARLC